MARINVYLPDELAADVRHAGLNVSQVAQGALRRELDSHRTSAWLATVRSLPPAGVSHEEAVTALDQVRAESGDDWPAGHPDLRPR